MDARVCLDTMCLVMAYPYFPCEGCLNDSNETQETTFMKI